MVSVTLSYYDIIGIIALLVAIALWIRDMMRRIDVLYESQEELCDALWFGEEVADAIQEEPIVTLYVQARLDRIKEVAKRYNVRNYTE